MPAALDLKVEQLSDPDVRSFVIPHEHPEFEQALKQGRREIEGGDGPMNPRLHLIMHEIVATQHSLAIGHLFVYLVARSGAPVRPRVEPGSLPEVSVGR